MSSESNASQRPIALDARALEGVRGKTGYPAPFRERVAGRSKVVLGDRFGLSNFGVNLTRLEPGAVSALCHWHTRQDEFVFVLEGELTLVTDTGETVLSAGMCAGFPAARQDGHHLVNRSDTPTVYLEVGDRSPGDEAYYPDEDLVYRDNRFFHRDGTPW